MLATGEVIRKGEEGGDDIDGIGNWFHKGGEDIETVGIGVEGGEDIEGIGIEGDEGGENMETTGVWFRKEEQGGEGIEVMGIWFRKGEGGVSAGLWKRQCQKSIQLVVRVCLLDKKCHIDWE